MSRFWSSITIICWAALTIRYRSQHPAAVQLADHTVMQLVRRRSVVCLWTKTIPVCGSWGSLELMEIQVSRPAPNALLVGFNMHICIKHVKTLALR